MSVVGAFAGTTLPFSAVGFDSVTGSSFWLFESSPFLGEGCTCSVDLSGLGSSTLGAKGLAAKGFRSLTIRNFQIFFARSREVTTR